MLSALVAAAERFEREETLPRVATKAKTVKWVVRIDAAGVARLFGPYKAGDLRRIRSPDMLRSGTKLPPFLLTDKARYVLGVAQSGKERTDEETHREFVQLIRSTYEQVKDEDLAQILAFLEDSPLAQLGDKAQRIEPEDLVAFQNDSGDFPCEREEIQQFWATHLANDPKAIETGICLVCGTDSSIVRTFPNSVVIMGQPCQITSFQQGAFRSFGKAQTANAPICFSCASRATATIEFLRTEPRHRSTLVRVEKNGKPDPMQSQLAVFWLKEAVVQSTEIGEVDLQAALAEPVQAAELTGAPPPELSQLQAFLRIPWGAQQHATNLDTNSFFLAVLSASKTRLVVREWLEVPLTNLRDHLGAYVQATRICGPRGEEPRPFSIPSLLAAVNSTDPNGVRGLLRTAYQGVAPPGALLNAALSQFGKPKYLVATKEKEEDFQTAHLVASLLKLLLTHGKGDAERMERLDMSRDVPAYLCGRILGIVEEMQRRSADTKLNRTLVERLYATGTNSPATALAELTMLAETAYLPKLRKATNKGFGYLQSLLTDTMSLLDEKGGVPPAFTPAQRAEFALGLYAQRADFSKK
jgi:CRISPR-associated protein Csd1